MGPAAAVEPAQLVEPPEPVEPAKAAEHHDQATTFQDLAPSDNNMLNNTPTSLVDSRNPETEREPATSSTKESKITRLHKISTELLDISSEVATDIGISGVLFSFDPLEKQCDKAARILKAFCAHGGFKEEKTKKKKNKTKTAQDASKIIEEAQGLLVFSTFRAGIKSLSGSSGSGVLLTRRLPGGGPGSDINNRKWSPPVAIQVYSVGRGSALGIESCDCVVVMNTQEAVQDFIRELSPTGRYTLGGEKKTRTVSLEGEQGPVIVPFWEVIHLADFPVPFRKKKEEEEREKYEEDITIYSSRRGIFISIFTRSRRMKGSVITLRKEANNAFYGAHLEVEDILRGKVPPQGPQGLWPGACEGLYMALKDAEVCRECGEGAFTHSDMDQGAGRSNLPPLPEGVTPTTACSEPPYATPVFAAVD
ncbi:Family of unknown function (DUF500) domain containing protein [Rhypophila sp. PSN 637]